MIERRLLCRNAFLILVAAQQFFLLFSMSFPRGSLHSSMIEIIVLKISIVIDGIYSAEVAADVFVSCNISNERELSLCLK